MPIYEYLCEQCGNEFESFIWSAKDEESLACPKCGAVDVKKLLSSFASKGSLSSVLGTGCGTGGFS
ncbi:FmdB family zinc ribbon protein [Desulfosoma caldarium]|uniref:Putative FmdB family regulatory protein n=1 Tax=Desulfosoma caldarium TaxID=610254 RepID=A0A3N1VKY1_9BACT|nr:zinc ribbon domain-containing protein [Desulfosoma caldarium]ROR01601.1 putative FmdB family regulatory protein [Desulfosoma caldarium]